jgi:hypothetical protein
VELVRSSDQLTHVATVVDDREEAQGMDVPGAQRTGTRFTKRQEKHSCPGHALTARAHAGMKSSSVVVVTA